jgi:hypothetical protein
MAAPPTLGTQVEVTVAATEVATVVIVDLAVLLAEATAGE